MSAFGVEFYEIHSEVAEVPPALVTRRRTLRPYAAMALWTIAAALAVWAPFSRFYTVSAAGQVGFDYHADGWGRLRASDNVSATIHIERYGIALAAVAAVLVLLILSQLRPVARLAPVVRVTAILVPALTSGLIVAGLLNLQVVVDQVRSANVDMTPPDPAGAFAPPRLHLAVGPFLWITSAAVVAAIVAAVLLTRHRQQPASIPAEPVGDMTEVDGIPGAESLDVG